MNENHFIGIGICRADQYAFCFKEIGHTALTTQGTAMLRKCQLHIRSRAVAVVRQRLHHDSYTSRTVALVGELVQCGTTGRASTTACPPKTGSSVCAARPCAARRCT